MMNGSSEVIRQRREKAKALTDQGVDLYPNDFKVSHRVKDVRQSIARQRGGVDDTGPFAMAGRIITLRSFGKAALSISGTTPDSFKRM